MPGQDRILLAPGLPGPLGLGIASAGTERSQDAIFAALGMAPKLGGCLRFCAFRTGFWLLLFIHIPNFIRLYRLFDTDITSALPSVTERNKVFFLLCLRKVGRRPCRRRYYPVVGLVSQVRMMP